MRDQDKTQEQLIDELAALRRRNAELEALVSDFKLVQEKPLMVGEILIEMGHLTRSQMEQALEKQKESNETGQRRMRLASVLVELGLVTGEQMGAALEIQELRLAEQLETRQRIDELEESEAARRKVEEELREAQEYAQAIIHSSLDMIIAVDRDRRIIEFNEAAQRTFGYRREEVLGKNVEILYRHPQNGLEVYESIKEAGQFTGEIANKRKNGESFPSFLCASVLRDAMGGFIGFMGISRDITEQKRTVEELRESEKLAKGIVEDLRQLVWEDPQQE